MYDISKKELSELKQLISLGQKYLWRNDDCMRMIQDSGIHLVRGDFYSPIPTLAEIDSSWEKTDEPPYLNDQYDNEFMCGFLEDELLPYAEEFVPPMDDTGELSTFYWKNPQFSYSDAMSYYCLVRAKKPKRIVEIGSGYSTLVALEAVKRNGFGEITCIEPYPSKVLKSVGAEVNIVESPVQSSTAMEFASRLAENDVLFIDSTHTVKVGGDCLYIYLKLLPAIAHGVYVHAHDVFLPYMFPESNLVLQQYWTEQYLLGAYMLDNPNVRILFASYYHYMKNRDLLERFMGNKYQSGGSSFYFMIDKGQ